ncbi:MAG: hypothetical protein HQ567_33480 [Candidatus Nealsonbacteria bacterium]|nr:hypothetical protein [Candidatus Nealsonbacteria bacterium]
MRNIKELLFLARDYYRYLRGKDYFRQPQPLGAHFRDDRCYYNDLTGKAAWDGTYIDGVPALRVATNGSDAVLPVTVLLYGLGSMDRYFLEDRREFIDNVRNAAAWMIANVLPEGHYNNHLKESTDQDEFYSSNSAMTQGLALSFAVRTVTHELVDQQTADELRGLIRTLVGNMLLPVARRGTALHEGDDLFLMEFCRKDHTIVLNGWIFALFGLIDYTGFCHDEQAEAGLKTSLSTMAKVLPEYQLPNGWSYYDNAGRICSPFYHNLHIALLDAMHRLTGEPVFAQCRDVSRQANRRWNRVVYTVNKIKDKLLDRDVYTSQGRRGRKET